MERETKVLKTPDGHELTLKTYLTARERNAIRDVFLKASKFKIDAEGGQKQDYDLDGSVLSEIQNKIVEFVVVKYREITSPDAILNTLLDCKPEEYDFVVEEAQKVNGNLTKAK